MGEKYSPLITNPFMEVNWTRCGFRLEIGRNGSKTESARPLDVVTASSSDWEASHGSGRCSLDISLYELYLRNIGFFKDFRS